MPNHYFGWTSDVNGDGVPEVLRYSTTSWVPDVDPADDGRPVASEVLGTLDGGVFVATRLRAGRYDHTAPPKITLSWGLADPELVRIVEEDKARQRLVSVRYDYRWRQLEVTSSGAADRKVTVAAGWLDSATGRAWLSADTERTCGATDTLVWVTASAGTLTVSGGTVLPAGATQLAAISIAGDVVTVLTDPSGAANAKVCKILRSQARSLGSGALALEVELQQVEA